MNRRSFFKRLGLLLGFLAVCPKKVLEQAQPKVYMDGGKRIRVPLEYDRSDPVIQMMLAKIERAKIRQAKLASEVMWGTS